LPHGAVRGSGRFDVTIECASIDAARRPPSQKNEPRNSHRAITHYSAHASAAKRKRSVPLGVRGA